MPEAKANRRVSPARQTAFDILRRVEQEGSFASTLIAALPEVELSREDRALTQELVLGTLRWRATLDFLIASYTGRRIEKLDLPVVIALRLGIYQIRFLTRIPVSAAVNESVKLVKRARLVSAATLTNAVLRRAVERRDDPPGVDMPAGLGRTAIEVSHPRWMLERWERSIGYEQMRELALANNQAPAVCFRVNTLRWSTEDAIAELEREGVKVRASEMTAGAFVAEHGSGLAGTRAAKGGLIYIQDEASQLVSLAVAAEPGQKILDLCAAPGSKSTHIATLTGDRSWIAACDVHHRRLAVLKESASRLGIKSISRLAADAAHSLPFSEDAQFDRVLLDAPCSGTGTLRQHPEIKWRLKPDDIERLGKMQLQMLENAAGVAAPGGRLVYSTCSMEPEEGEDVVQTFLSGRFGAGFRAVIPSGFKALATPEGFIRTYPHRNHVDGFFAAVLDKADYLGPNHTVMRMSTSNI